MSREANVELPNYVAQEELFELLGQLGFKRKESLSPLWDTPGAFQAFSWFDERDYHSYTGVYAVVGESAGHLTVYVRTNESAGYWDVHKQNDFLRSARKRLGAKFESDVGKNRYFPVPAEPPVPAEAGCLLAFRRFDFNIERAIFYLSSRSYPESFRTGPHADLLRDLSPWVLSNNLLLPYLVSAMEDYFKSTFIALLRYSTRKEMTLKGVRLSGEHLARISDGKMSVEEAVVEALSFQNLRNVSEQFRALEPKLDIHGVLHKPFRRRKVALFDSIVEMVDRRHELIHRGTVNPDFDDAVLERSIKDLFVAIDRIYGRIAEINGWNYAPSGIDRKIQMRYEGDSGKDGA